MSAALAAAARSGGASLELRAALRRLGLRCSILAFRRRPRHVARPKPPLRVSLLVDIDGGAPVGLGRTSMHVERLVASDVARYRELMLHAYASAPDAFTSTAEERANEPDSWWLRRIADPRGQSLALGALRDGQLVGTVTVEFSAKPKTRHKVQVIGMFVHESCRGLGAGAKLVQAALAEASARSEVRVVTLTVTQGNVPAVNLYERFGFRPFGVEPMAIATPGGYRSRVHMWLPIGESGGERRK